MLDADLKSYRVQKLFTICKLEIKLVYFLNIQINENRAVEVIAEFNKDKQQQVIDNLKQNYK